MGDVSEFFKSGILDLCKSKIGKNYQQKSIRDRVSNFNNRRRETRTTLMFRKRQIDENMTPCSTPESSKYLKQTEEKKDVNKPNKRLEMLQKWKIEKQKRKQEEKQKAKPLFKVCHVPIELGLPDLENVNKQIKGKSIKLNVSHTQSQFAPPNHKFQAPKTVKPIDMGAISNNSRGAKPKTGLSKININLDSQKKDTHNLRSTTKENVSQIITRATRATTRNLLEGKNSKTTEHDKKLHIKTVTNKTNINKTVSTSKDERKNEKLNVKEHLQNNMVKDRSGNNSNHSMGRKAKLLENPRNTSTKNVCWNKVEIIGDKDFSAGVNINTPKDFKKKYNKTPRREQKLKQSKIPDIQSVAGYNEDLEGNTSPVTPKMTKSYKKLSESNFESELAKLGESDPNNSNTKSQSSTVGSASGSASPDYPIDKDTVIGSDFQTPVKNNIQDPVYISPFVTVSRGKSSARKEYYIRQSVGNLTPEFGVDISNSTSPKAGAEYFSKKLSKEIVRIENVCDTWNDYKTSNEIPEEAHDMINVAIGQSKLLISKKFQQFRSLIEQCKKAEYEEKPVSCEDLHGFWDMIYMQVEDLNKRFNNLNELKANNWQEIIPEKKPVVKRGRGRPKKASASSALKNLIKSARNMKKSSVEGETNLLPQPEEIKKFNDGHFPAGNEPQVKNSSARKSLRVTVLTNQTNRLSSSPGLTMMKISQAIKCGDGLTPGRSILKNDIIKSAKSTKSVLFRDNLEDDIEDKVKDVKSVIDEENDISGLDLITFSPIASTRRSRRRSNRN